LACHWRIRHKLILGLGLVVGIIALLLAGTLKGFLALSNTLKSIDSKVLELKKAKDLMDVVSRLGVDDLDKKDPDTIDPKATERLLHKIAKATTALDEYGDQLQKTLDRHRDPDQGYYESKNIQALDVGFTQLRQVIDHPRVEFGGSSQPLIKDPEVVAAIQKLADTSGDLQSVIYGKIEDFYHDAKGYYRDGLITVLTTGSCGILLIAGLFRFFYGWVVHPIRHLEVGAGRVAQGDFDHRIEVHSGDEMEDLAEAFNNMTGRLREMYRDLAHQVNERSRQLVRSERLASVGFLAAGVAHEINNPLASIAFCSEALEGRMSDILARAPSDAEVITKYLKMIQQEAFRCKAITQRLLEFSRSGERRREATDLAELIQSVLDVVQHLQNYKGKQVIFDPPGRILAWVNAQEIKSVVLNLIVNALDSMDEEGTLTIMLGQRDRMAEMVFSDTGCGMSPEILENIFEPFFTRSRTGKGTGLGLSISHRVITQHAGEIEASSPGPNRGSTFTVRLPLQPVEEQGVRGPQSGADDQEAGATASPRETRRRAA
jgi:signal transduction histidine kinase